MVCGMATSKITITLPNGQLERVRAIVAAGHSPNVSAFVARSVSTALADIDGWSAMLGQALQETGGPLTAKERRWADAILAPPRREKPRRKAA
jgi:Arc/MetJ-type ribon-helix-helix transcriptional regulator